MTRLEAIYRSWAIPCAGQQVYAPRYRAEWLAKISEAGVRRRAELYYPTTRRPAAVAPGSAAGSIGLTAAWHWRHATAGNLGPLPSFLLHGCASPKGMNLDAVKEKIAEAMKAQQQ
jgi:hypothetical protein